MTVHPDTAVKTLDELLHQALVQGASDVHFESGEDFFRTRFRIDGLLRVAATPALTLRDAIVRLTDCAVRDADALVRSAALRALCTLASARQRTVWDQVHKGQEIAFAAQGGGHVEAERMGRSPCCTPWSMATME